MEDAQSVTKRTYKKIQNKHKAMTYPIELHVLYSICYLFIPLK